MSIERFFRYRYQREWLGETEDELLALADRTKDETEKDALLKAAAGLNLVCRELERAGAAAVDKDLSPILLASIQALDEGRVL